MLVEDESADAFLLKKKAELFIKTITKDRQRIA
jgi:hypothetical protein